MDKYVIGQEHAKKVIAVAVYNHYCRLRSLIQQKSIDNLSDYGVFTSLDSNSKSKKKHYFIANLH